MKHSLPDINSSQQNQRWLGLLCAFFMLAWMPQVTANWYKPHSDIGLSQLKKIELAHTLEHERLEPSRTTRLDYKPDPVALPGAIDATWISATNLRLFPELTASRLKPQATALPAIRAPPPFPSR